MCSVVHISSLIFHPKWLSWCSKHSKVYEVQDLTNLRPRRYSLYVYVDQVLSLLVVASHRSVQISWILRIGFRLGTSFMLSLPISADVNKCWSIFPAVLFINCTLFVIFKVLSVRKHFIVGLMTSLWLMICTFCVERVNILVFLQIFLKPMHVWELQPWLVAWHSSNAFHSINEVTVCRAGLVLRWVTACGQVNHLGM